MAALNERASLQSDPGVLRSGGARRMPANLPVAGRVPGPAAAGARVSHHHQCGAAQNDIDAVGLEFHVLRIEHSVFDVVESASAPSCWATSTISGGEVGRDDSPIGADTTGDAVTETTDACGEVEDDLAGFGSAGSMSQSLTAAKFASDARSRAAYPAGTRPQVRRRAS